MQQETLIVQGLHVLLVVSHAHNQNVVAPTLPFSCHIPYISINQSINQSIS